jgi:hypothetical protein
MRRRQYLATLSLSLASAGLAGCTGRDGGSAEAPTPSRRPTLAPARVGDVTLPVDGSEMVTAIHPDGIPAIIEPAFGSDWADWSAVAPQHRPDDPPTLPDEVPVVGVEHGGEARAYPLAVLDWHEVVNDRFGGPLLVTYCPLCGSAVVADRVVEGEGTLEELVPSFGVSGKLWRNDLVLYDSATGSLWSQLLATAIRGPLTGTRLRLRPSTLTTWAEWRTAHPGTVVLLPPPGSVTVRGRRPVVSDYADSKYNYEREDQLVGYDREGAGLTERTLVVGVEHDGVARAYPFAVVVEAGVVADRVGGLPVVVTTAPGGGLVAYDRRVDGETPSFTAAGERHLSAGGSRWERSTGRAVDGPHAGARLTWAGGNSPMFWRAWCDFNPETEVYRG